MNELRVCETVLAGALALAAACPQVLGAPPAAPVPAVKAAEPAPATLAGEGVAPTVSSRQFRPGPGGQAPSPRWR